MEIIKLESAVDRESLITQVKEIFFLCSSLKTFISEQHKSDFFQKWCGDYIKQAPKHFYIAIENNNVLGYLSGHLDSTKALDEFKIAGPDLFRDQFTLYPAHFHINCHPNGQGKGVGRKLVEKFSEDLKSLNVDGVHLITSTDADNLGFYRALGFINEFKQPLKNIELLLMAKTLS